MNNLEKDLKKLKIQFKNVHLKITKEDRARHKEVVRFIKSIERAHKLAAKSKLRFRV